MDSSVENGGKGNGVRPMQMLLMGLGGCSAIDVAMILKKQRQELTGFRMEIDGEREKGKEPSIWEKVHLIFHLAGPNLDPDKAVRAVELSMTKYCSVAETLRRAGGDLTWETKVNQ
jgi:putative redox protein